MRELENVIERAVALGSGPVIETADLPSSLPSFTNETMSDENEILQLAELKRRAILRTLRESKGDKLHASRQLGIGKTTLYRKLKTYDTRPSRTATNQVNID